METIIYAIFAAHHWAEGCTGGHDRHGRLACWLCALGYLTLAAAHLWHG